MHKVVNIKLTFNSVSQVLFALLALTLITIHITAVINYIHYGSWPTYNNPQSYTSYPLNTTLGQVVYYCISFLVISLPLGLLISLLALIESVTKFQLSSKNLLPLFNIILIALVFYAPTSFWFLD